MWIAGEESGSGSGNSECKGPEVCLLRSRNTRGQCDWSSVGFGREWKKMSEGHR